jgi:hypothetical protein
MPKPNKYGDHVSLFVGYVILGQTQDSPQHLNVLLERFTYDHTGYKTIKAIAACSIDLREIGISSFSY